MSKTDFLAGAGRAQVIFNIPGMSLFSNWGRRGVTQENEVRAGQRSKRLTLSAALNRTVQSGLRLNLLVDLLGFWTPAVPLRPAQVVVNQLQRWKVYMIDDAGLQQASLAR